MASLVSVGIFPFERVSTPYLVFSFCHGYLYIHDACYDRGIIPRVSKERFLCSTNKTPRYLRNTIFAFVPS